MSQSNFHQGDAGQSTSVQAEPVRSAHRAVKSPRFNGGVEWPAGHQAPDRRARLDELGEQLERAMERIDAHPITRMYR